MWSGIIEDMLQKLGVIALVLGAGFMIGCASASRGPEGSLHQTQTGVSETGYPGGKPIDAESPALASSSEQKYSRAEAPYAEGEAKPGAEK